MSRVEDYVVIMVAPLKKLVTRDYQEFKNKEHVVHYEMLNKDVSEKVMHEAKIHFITINTLIGNPGEDNIDITYKKRNYIEQIQKHCFNNKKQVVFLFDEIHAAINVFAPQFVMNLWKWKGITHKSYLLSATYTESSKMVIEYIAYLTDYRIKIYETERTKFATLSKLHLFITMGSSYTNDLTLLEPLAEVITKAASEKKRVQIITAYKDLATTFVKGNTSLEIVKAVNRLEHNLLTAQTDNVFNETLSNIGTTFHTGINFEHEDDILIVVLPSSMGKPDSKSGGVFTDGKVAIHQAIARLRTGGDIYVVMPMPETVIEGDYLKWLRIFKDTKQVPVVAEDKQYMHLWEFYKDHRDKVELQIIEADKLMQVGDWNNRAPIRYPSFGEFILESGDRFLASRFESFGKGYAPYMLWAAFNDQFENTTLATVSFLYHDLDEIIINEERIFEDLKAYFEEIIPELIPGKTLHDAYRILVDALKDTGYKTGDSKRTKILYTDKSGNQKKYGKDDILWPIPLRRGLINLLHYSAKGIYYDLTEVDYVTAMIFGAWEKSKYWSGVDGEEEITKEEGDKLFSQLSSMNKLYLLLGEVCGCITGAALPDEKDLPADLKDSKIGELPDGLYYLAFVIIKNLKVLDPFLSRAQPYELIFRQIDPFNGIKKMVMPKNWMDIEFEKLTAIMTAHIPEEK